MKKFHVPTILAALIVLAGMLTGCGSKPTPEPTPSSTPEPTATYTATASPEPTATPTPTPTPAPVTFADIVIPHTLEDRTDCISCHSRDGAMPYPEDHAGRLNDACQYCHIPTEQLEVSPDVNAFTKVECLTCHGPFEVLMAKNIEAVAEDGNTANPHVYVPHDSTDILECTLCHQPHALPDPQITTDAAPVSIEACYECHHIRNFTDCHQCHPIIPIKE